MLSEPNIQTLAEYNDGASVHLVYHGHDGQRTGATFMVRGVGGDWYVSWSGGWNEDGQGPSGQERTKEVQPGR